MKRFLRQNQRMHLSSAVRLVSLFAVVSLAAGCGKAPAERAWFTMGTFAAVSTSGQDASRIDEAEKLVKSQMTKLERLWSNYDSRSEISRLNRKSGTSLKVSDETIQLLLISKEMSRSTGGSFDPTVGPLVDLWGIGSKDNFKVPSGPEIADAIKLCGWQGIQVSEDDGTASLTKSGMTYDSGGVAKGLAVDICFDQMVGLGIKNMMVNLGGNMRCMGAGRKGAAWNVGVRNPFDRDKIVGILKLTDGMAVATSGNYERFVEKDGKRYAHVINPLTGAPVEGMAGVTVVAPTAVVADALSTALFVSGVEKGCEILKQYPDCKAIFIEDNQPMTLQLLPGMEDMLELVDDVPFEVLTL